MSAPLRFTPFLRPMVWGGRRLGEFLSQPLEPGKNYGEAWMVSDHPLHLSAVENGPWAGRSLRQLMEECPSELLGRAAKPDDRFPWLIKFLDAQDWLSVQVHPDEQAVNKLWPGEGSKTEAWFILDASAGSKIYAGLRAAVDETGLRAALRAGTVANCLHHFQPRPGDCVFLPAGTVHAVGGGVLFAEIQQTSDATFRLFDWNRRDAQGRGRPLHIEEALASIHWDRGPVEPIRVDGFGKTRRRDGETAKEQIPIAVSPTRRFAESQQADRQQLVTCPYFTMEYIRARESFTCGGEGRLQALVVITSRGRWAGPSCQEEIKKGQVWVLPASMRRISAEIHSDLTGLLCTLP
jgi:mannose-6-phosphate isomerase